MVTCDAESHLSSGSFGLPTTVCRVLGQRTGITSGTTLWTGDGDQEAGVWECTAGPSRWSLENNEFVHILSGRMTVTPDGGEPTDIGPGDTAVFPRGWTGTWQIHETIRKLYVLF